MLGIQICTAYVFIIIITIITCFSEVILFAVFYVVPLSKCFESFDLISQVSAHESRIPKFVIIGESTIAEEGFWHGGSESTATVRVAIQIEDEDGGAWNGGGCSGDFQEAQQI
ncbi:hypothetical protein Q3G72_015064 [Acer saccharum]|nr:hypothetical protein Q3G72_015064 [Acer saccharum]